MNIKVLGSGCAKCVLLKNNVIEALAILKKEAIVEKVTDFKDIASYGVMSTPALVVDGKVLFSGKVLDPKSLAELLK